MKGALVVAGLTIVGVAAAIAISALTRPDTAEEIAARPGFAWARQLPVKGGLSTDSRIDPRLGRIASDIAGRPVEARCWSKNEWPVVLEEWRLARGHVDWEPAGFAEPARTRIHLHPEVCEPLARFAYGRYTPQSGSAYELATALAVLAHEAEHVRVPSASEAEVECYALQRVRRLVVRGGRSTAYANELAALAWEIAYPVMEESYRTRDCRNGGRLDLRPNSRVWP